MKLKNKYYIMRHGQALSNVKRLCSNRPEKFKNPLTEYGQEMVRESAENLKEKLDKAGQEIDLVFHSPLLRTKLTAEIAGKILQAPKIKPDIRLREIGFGIFNNKGLDGMWRYFDKENERIKRAPPKGETYMQILNRLTDFIKSVEQKYQGRNILLVSHEGPLFLLQGNIEGLSIEGTINKYPPGKRIHKAEIRELN